MTDLLEADVVIVGGGPVGLTQALLLANYGLSSVILEVLEARDSLGSKALCMQRDVLDVLARVGVGEEIAHEGVTWTVGRTYYKEHELFLTTFPDRGQAHFPPFVNVGQDRTEAWLERRITEQPLCEIRYAHEATAIQQVPDGVEVEVRAPAGPLTVRARYLVGADGGRSWVRKTLDVGFPGISFDDRFLICDIRADLPFAKERRFFFDPEWNPGRQVLIHPQADSVWRIDWQVPPDFDLAADQESGMLDSRIRRITGDAPFEIVWMSVYRFHERLAERFQVGRCFLAGDAAHIVAPFGARGLNSGIQDAENLAWKIAYVMQNHSPETILDSYHDERRAAAMENLEVTTATMQFLVPQTEEHSDLRTSTLEAAISDPAAQASVDSGKLAVPFVYRDSALTTPDVRALAGSLCLDGPVDVPGMADVSRLRELFGASFVVLTSEHDVPIHTNVPVDVYVLSDIDVDGVIAGALAVDQNVVVRPDGHIAAIVDATAVAGAIDRATGNRSE